MMYVYICGFVGTFAIFIRIMHMVYVIYIMFICTQHSRYSIIYVHAHT